MLSECSAGPQPGSPKPPRNVGSRRIFPALFKLHVLDAYRTDHDCKGNQRATARKFNIHRRQIQKWLQCEATLRANVDDASRYNETKNPKHGANTISFGPPSSAAARVYKQETNRLKLSAQILYPSISSDASSNDRKCEVSTKAPRGYLVPKEYQLNDTISTSPRQLIPLRKLSMDSHSAMQHSLKLKNDVSGPNSCCTRSKSESPVQKFTYRCEEPSGLAAVPVPPRPTPLYQDLQLEPYNLIKPMATPRAMSPLPARVAEIVANSKSSAFSPKRKWLQDSLQDNFQEPLALLTPKQTEKDATLEPPKAKKPCHNFSIERLCGVETEKTAVKTELEVTPSPSPAPAVISRLPFPPPLELPHRTIPHLQSLHFRPECSVSPLCKQEAVSEDEDEPIDVLTTTPIEEKVFRFPEADVPGVPVQLNISVINANFNDQDFNYHQRLRAKLDVNRATHIIGPITDSCARCPQHCISPQHRNPGLRFPNNLPWSHPNATSYRIPTLN